MEIPDLPTYNAANACCGCGFPICDENTAKCESLTHTSSCADDDYTDLKRIWDAKVAAHDAWEDEHASFAARHATWVTEHAAWESCMETPPCTGCGAEPVEPVDPDEPPAPGTKPEKPEGYDDPIRSCYLPYKQPAGEPTDEIPTVYQTETIINITTWDGEGWGFQSAAGTFPTSAETKGHGTFHIVNSLGDPATTYTEEGEQNIHDPLEDPVCQNIPLSAGYKGMGVLLPFDVDYTYEEPENVCEPTEMSVVIRGTSKSGTEPSLAGCPGPFGGDDGTYSWDYTYENREGRTLGSGVTKSDVITRARDNLPSTWPEEAEGAYCSASVVVTWPLISDGLIGGDPEADPPVEPAWPVCFAIEQPLIAGGEATATKTRYKMGIPLYMQAHRLWIIAHAQWVIDLARFIACETEGDPPLEPEEPKIFHYFAIQWDVVFFPKKWAAWRILYDAWVEATALHDAWEIEHDEWVANGSDPETEPEEPDVPADPTSDQPADRPVFIDEDLFWEWTGGETEAEQYEATWHTIAAPTTEGESLIVNRQVKCMQSIRTGVPPTFYAPQYNPDDYPA